MIKGANSAYTRRYSAPNAATAASAPKICNMASAPRNPARPIRHDKTTISNEHTVKMRLASSSFFSPKRRAICTEEPTAIKSGNTKLMRRKGMTRLTAAKASSPRKRPTKMPSATV